MRHRKRGRKLGRKSEHRKALLKNLSTEVLKHERIVTTLPKAKEARRVTEKLITLGKKGDLASRRRVFSIIRDKTITTKLFDDISQRFAERPGGYTRILKLGEREGDSAEMAILELVEKKPIEAKETKKPIED